VLAPPPADEVPDVAEAAAAYARRLEAAFGGVPHFDLVLLGMGADGHTASLFPGDEAALSATGITTPGRAPVAPHDRVSLTVPVLNAGREVLVLVSGEAKREALARVEAGADLPAARLTTATFVVDRAAAGAD
jgi:6-phosphogluconolactonase